MPTIEKIQEKFSRDLFCPSKNSCLLLQEALREKERIKAENEKSREIFEFATIEFEKRNERIASLKDNLTRANTVIKGLR